jgi:hypothetical protein
LRFGGWPWGRSSPLLETLWAELDDEEREIEQIEENMNTIQMKLLRKLSSSRI